MVSTGVLIGALLLIVFGCTAVDRHVVQPVEPSFPPELNGPYDRDIPEAFVAMLRNAFAKDMKAVPYLFTAIGMHFEMAADDIRSLHFYDRAIKAFNDGNYPSGAKWATTRKIMVLSGSGKIKEAELLAGSREGPWRDLLFKAFADYAFGRLSLTNGNYEAALQSFGQAIKDNVLYRESLELSILRRDTEFGAGEALIYGRYVPLLSKKTGWVEPKKDMLSSSLQRIEQGIGHLKRALDLNNDIRRMKMAEFLPQIHFAMVDANVCNLIGLAENLRGNTFNADLYLKRSLRLSQMTGNPVGEADSLFFLNQIYWSGRNIEEGQKTAQLLHALADRCGLRFYQVWSGYLLARYEMDKGENADALATLKRTLIFLERPGWVSEAASKPYLLFDGRAVYELMITLLAGQDDARGCLETADRAKTKELNDLLAGENIGRTPFEAALVAESRRMTTIMRDIQGKLFRCADGAAVSRLAEKMTSNEKEYDLLRFRIEQTNPAMNALISMRDTDSAAIQKNLDENTTLFSYFVTDAHVYIWVMNKDRLHLERFDMVREDLRQLVISFFDAIRRDDKVKVKALSAVVYDTLLKPVMTFVTGDRLGIIAHDVLHYLPFAASSYRGKYLAEGFSIFYLPRLSSLVEHAVNENTGRMKVLYYGNPLSNGKEENGRYADIKPARLKKRFPDTDVVMRDPDSVSNIKERMDAYDLIHFAVKGDYCPADPLNSALSWPSDGQKVEKMTAASIFKLHMAGQAAVLSATEAKPDLQSDGQDIVLMNQAFLYAGMKAVVSSLWPVGGPAKVHFLDVFYAHLEKKNDLADSLQHAQSEWIRKGYTPYWWASYKLMGN